MLLSIVDDDEDFCEAVRRWTYSFAKKTPDLDIQLTVCSTAQQLFAFLGTLDHSGAEGALVLLDLDFDGRKTAGVETLVRIRNCRKTAIRKIPVVIYSNSDDPTEVEECYLKFASSYVWKGDGYEQKRRFINLIGYWTSTALVPQTA